MIALSKSSDSVLLNCRVEESGVHVSNRGVYLKEYFDHYYSDSDLQQKIESAVAEHNQATQDTLQGYMDNEQQLLEQIEELKAKLPQPVEISRDLADAIECMKKRSLVWEPEFLSLKLELYFSSDSVYSKLLISTDYNVRLNIVKNGYTVKPEPTLEEKILKSIQFPFGSDEDTAKEIMSILKNEGMFKDEEA